MKILAYVLGAIAILGSLFVGTSWVRASRGASTAIAAAQKAQANVSEWEFADRLEHQNVAQKVELAEKRLRLDGINIEIAELQGRSTGKLREQRALDADRLEAAQLVQSSDEELQRLGPSEKVQAAQERVDACMLSLQTYRGTAARDEKLAYVVGAVWLAFGFALAFASRPAPAAAVA